MKFLLLLAAALALTASAAPAQTAGPGPVPGSQPVVTPDMRNAGSPRAPSRDEKAPGMSHRAEKRLRKMGKPKSNPDGTMKTN